MPRFPLLIALLSLTPNAALAVCRAHAVGEVRFIEREPFVIVYRGSLGETRLKISASPQADRAELMLHLLGANGRIVDLKGDCAAPPHGRVGEVFTDITRVRLTLPDAARPNGGDQLTVDPADQRE